MWGIAARSGSKQKDVLEHTLYIFTNRLNEKFPLYKNTLTIHITNTHFLNRLCACFVINQSDYLIFGIRVKWKLKSHLKHFTSWRHGLLMFFFKDFCCCCCFFFLRTGTKILRATRNDRDRLATNTSRYDKQITSPLTLYIVWKMFSILKIVFIFIYLIWFSVFKGKRKQYRQHVLYFLNVLLFTWSFLFFFQFIRGSSSKLGSSDALYTYICI